jgi:LysR family glycine cleavage system transcriptional activator
MKKLPPLIELRAFEAAARHMSFKNAAAELGVTPAAITIESGYLNAFVVADSSVVAHDHWR